MPNILFLIPSLRPGGAERQLVELIKGLDKSRYNMLVGVNEHVTEGYETILNDLDVSIIEIIRKSKYDVGQIFRINTILKHKRIDIIHAFLTYSSLFGLLSGKLRRIPVICSALREVKDLKLSHKIANIFLAAAADFLVSNSKAGFTSRFRTMKRSFFVIRNGVDFDRFIADRFTQEKIRNELGLSRTRKVIGMIASLSEHKDQDTFIRAAASVLQRELDVVFLVIGEETPGSAIKAKLEKLAASLNISSNVLFLGHRDDVDQLVQLLDIVVLVTNPKVHAEGTANSLLEAMAAKVPVIASEGEGTKEVIENEVTGLLVRPEAPDELSCAIIRVLKDSQLALTLATNGFRFAQQNFSLETCVAEYEQLYKQALNSRSDTPRSSHV